ncbi:MAG: hypothetical protein GY950_33340 [bacterium]|nr:hypothetical protein [bacterium]
MLYKTKTECNNITVTRKGDIITLWAPAGVKQTEVDITNPALPHLEYARNIMLSLAFHPYPESILILGLGGGAVPMMFFHACRSAHIDVVEIDGEIPAITEKYFGFLPAPRLKVFVDDASLYIKNTNGKKKYDIIIMDAYIGQKQHRPLTSAEFFLETRERLTTGGVFAINLMTKNKAHFENMKDRVRSAFNHLWLLPGETSTNTLAFAKMEKISKPGILSNVKRLQVPVPREIPLEKLAKKVAPCRGSHL